VTVSPRPAGTAGAPEVLNRPWGIAVAANGEVLIADIGESAIQRAGADGRFLPPHAAASLNQANALAVDAKGVIYVADTWNHRIVRLSPDGVPMGDLPTPREGMYAPRDVAVSPEGDVFVANTGRSRIERYAATGAMSGWGIQGSGKGEFSEPLALALSGREVFIADFGNARIQVFSYDGRFLRSWPVPAWKDASTGFRPAVVVFRDRVYVTDPTGGTILMYSKRGQDLGKLESPELQQPCGLAVSAEGTLFVSNFGSGTIAAVSLVPGGQPGLWRYAPR
jgi:tripartite motif-containing protein 71